MAVNILVIKCEHPASLVKCQVHGAPHPTPHTHTHISHSSSLGGVLVMEAEEVGGGQGAAGRDELSTEPVGQRRRHS